MQRRYVLLITLFTAIGLLVSPPTTASDIEEDGSIALPSLHVDAQVSDGSTVTISRVNANESLWVVIHADDNGEFGEVIGNSELLDAGLNVGVDVEIQLDDQDNQTGQEGENRTVTLHAMLHHDDGNGEYDFPNADLPMSNETGIIVHQFNVTIGDDPVVVATGIAEWQGGDDQDDNDTLGLGNDEGIEIGLARLARPGYVVLHLDTAGSPGQVIGNSDHLDAGEHNNVSIDLNSTLFSLNGTSTTLWAMIHFDDGDEEYTFPGPDEPVTVEGTPVMTLFPVQSAEDGQDDQTGDDDDDVGIEPSPTDGDEEGTPAPGVAALVLALAGMLLVTNRIRRHG